MDFKKRGEQNRQVKRTIRGLFNRKEFDGNKVCNDGASESHFIIRMVKHRRL